MQAPPPERPVGSERALELAAVAEAAPPREPAGAGRGGTLVAGQPPILSLAVFYAAYVAAAGLGQGLAIIPGVSITFWPPAGIFVATLLSNPRATWPWWVVAGGLAELTANAVWFGSSVPIALVYFAGNALEALAAATLIGLLVRQPLRLDTLGQVFAFVVLCAGCAPLVGATVIATTDALLGKHTFADAFLLVWLGDGTGLLVSTPLALIAIQTWRERGAVRGEAVLEALIVAGLLVLVGALSFWGFLPTSYIAVPLLVWAAARFQLRGAAAALALLFLMEAWFMRRGLGGLADPAAIRERAVALQAFLGIAAVSTLVVAALSQQHAEARRRLRDANDQLERRVAERTAALRESEAKLALFVEHAPAAIAMFDTNMRYLATSRRFLSDYGIDPSAGIVGRSHYEVLPDLPARWRAVNDRVFQGEAMSADEDLFVRGDGRTEWVRWSIAPWRRDDGTIGGALLFSEIITAEVETRRALAASEESLRLAQEAGELGTWEYDFATRTWRWPQRTRDLLAVAADTSATLETYLGRIHPADRAAVAERFDGAADDIAGEFRVTLPGGVRWLQDKGRVERGGGGAGAPVRARGVLWDVTDRHEREERLSLLSREVNHRAKNILGIVQAIARQTASEVDAPYVERFQERLQALAANHDLLVRNDWKGVDLGALVRAQLAHFADLVGERIEVAGPPVRLGASAAQSIGMALHELATNAGKYGALSGPNGRVEIAWQMADGTFTLSWIERGGPAVRPPTRRGFGTTVLKAMVQMSLGAEVELAFPAEGLSWRIECAADRLADGH